MTPNEKYDENNGSRAIDYDTEGTGAEELVGLAGLFGINFGRDSDHNEDSDLDED